jgi:PDZ domain-containing protein
MPLAALPKSKDNPNQKGSQIGIGISAMTKTALKTEPTVTFRTQNIGGPSAGLMFTLEIINQLTPTDLTGGHIIAGTGTVDEEGNVGQIGGIQYKVIGAYKQGAKIFLAPADIKPGDNNYALALQQVKRLQMDMQVVPVKTVKEAYEYLKGLPAPAHPVPGTLLHRQ